jgi:hypothetical protein
MLRGMGDFSPSEAGIREAPPRLPSAIVEDLLNDSDGESVTVGWLLRRAPVAGRETLILFIALVALIPGASFFAGLALLLLVLPMIAARPSVWLPRPVASHPIPVSRLSALIRRVLPVLRWQERVLPPGGARLAAALRPAVAILVLALSATLLVPIPLSNVLPAFAIAMLALACLEESVVLLAISTVTGFASLALTGGAVWSALAAAHTLLR